MRLDAGVAIFEPARVKVILRLEGVVVQVQMRFGAAAGGVDADNRAVMHVAMQFEGVMPDVVGFGVAVHGNGFGGALAGFAEGERVVVNFDATAQGADLAFFFEVDRCGVASAAGEFHGVVFDGDVAASCANAAVFVLCLVQDADEVFARFAADVVAADVQRVVHRRLVVAEFDAVGVDAVLVDFESADGVVADVEFARPFALQVLD